MYIAIDMGGTNTRIASSKNLVDIVAVEKFHTAKDLNIQKDRISQAILKLTRGLNIDAVVLGVAGIFSSDNKRLIHSPNLNFLVNLELTSLFDSNLNIKKFIFQNDCALAGLGEAVYGIGKDYPVVAYLSLGTGVGGVRIENKKLNPHQQIFEPGHMIIDFPSEVKDVLGIAGSLEYYVSGKGFHRMYNRNPLECKDPAPWRAFGKILGAGIINITVMWQPSLVIVGGGVGENYDLFYPGIVEKLDEISLSFKPVVTKSAFGEGSGLIGGLELIRQSL